LIKFVDEYRDQFGVEPICVVIAFPVSTYYAAKKREGAPSDPNPRVGR
jgi:putative transposase